MVLWHSHVCLSGACPAYAQVSDESKLKNSDLPPKDRGGTGELEPVPMQGAPSPSSRERDETDPKVPILPLRCVNIYLYKWSGFHQQQ